MLDIGTRTVAQVCSGTSRRPPHAVASSARGNICCKSPSQAGLSHTYTRCPRCTQVRSHAQKYFLRLEKEGHQEEIPPPRPKKRSARPYPVQARESPVRELKPKKKARRERSEAPPALRGRDTIFVSQAMRLQFRF